MNITVTRFFHIELNSDILLCLHVAVKIQIRQCILGNTGSPGFAISNLSTCDFYNTN